MKLRLSLFLLVSLFATQFASADTQGTRPNILIILADDLGYSDVGFNRGSDFPSELGEIPTPNLDELANDGIICTNGHVTHPFCGPSRASIMSGLYPHKMGAQYNLPNDRTCTLGIDENETYFSKVLQDDGYNTMALGKWHLGNSEGKYQPLDRGFDEFFGFLGGGHDYFRSEYDGSWYKYNTSSAEYNDPALYNEPKDNPPVNEYTDPLQRDYDYIDRKEYDDSAYLTDVLTDNAIDFIERKASDTNPFMMYLAYNAPHTPLQAPAEEIAAFKAANPGFEDGYRNSDYLLTANQVTKYTDSAERQEAIDYYVKNRTIYGTMVANMDENIGRVVAKLKELNEFDNTIIIFFSDNGGYTYSKGAVNYPLDALKGSTDEGGHRVPFFIHWPDQITTPSVYPYQVSSLDLYPICVGLAGATMPATKEVDGKNTLDNIIAGSDARANEALFVMRPLDGFHNAAIMSYPYRISRKANSTWELYDVRTNPQVELTGTTPEGVDVSTEISRLEDLGAAWSSDFLDVRPQWFDNEGDGTGHTHRILWFGQDLVGNTGTVVLPYDYARLFDDASLVPGTVAVSGITISDTAMTLEVGRGDKITAVITPIEATNKTIIWTTNASTVATVANDTITAVGAGNAVITATTEDGSFTATCSVTVVAADPNSAFGGPTGFTVNGGFVFEFEGTYDWTPQSDQTFFTITDERSYGATQSMKLDWDITPAKQLHMSSETGLLTGIKAGEYTISMHAYKKAGATINDVYLVIDNGNGSIKQIAVSLADVPEETWTEISTTYTAAVDFNADAYIRFRSKTTELGTGVVYVDNLIIAPEGYLTIKDSPKALDCTAMPNPAEDQLTISAPEANIIDVYSIMGAKVTSAIKTSEPFTMDISNLQSGTYLFQISSTEKNTIEKVIVK